MKSPVTLAAGMAVTALCLSACAGTGSDTAATETVTQTATANATTDAAAVNGSTTQQTASTNADEDAGQQRGDDPVFAAIDAVVAEYPGAIVVDIDREDDRATYDVDVVVDGGMVELEVAADGAVREDEREGDDDDVREAQAATVTAAEAISQALDQHPDGVLDELELDEDDGALHWEIDLDDSERGDLAELDVPAN